MVATVAIVDDHYCYPAKVGDGSVTVQAAGKQAHLAVKVLKVDRPVIRFAKDVMPGAGQRRM